jgi:hypothetical protein
MATISYTAVLPVRLDDAFSFVSNPTNWPSFFQDMQSAEVLDGWGAVGGTARMTNKLLGRTVISHLTLTEWEAPSRFRYRASQEARPAVDNLRVFEDIDGGTRLRGTTTITPRQGLAGLSDRVALRILARTYARAMTRLPAAISQTPDTGP